MDTQYVTATTTADQPKPEPLVLKTFKPARTSSVFERLRQKAKQAQNLLNAVEFARLMFSAGTNKKTFTTSLVEQHGLKTHNARALWKSMLPKKKRRRA